MILTSEMPWTAYAPEVGQELKMPDGTVIGVIQGMVRDLKKHRQTVTLDVYDTQQCQRYIFDKAKSSQAFKNMAEQLWPEAYRLWTM